MDGQHGARQADAFDFAGEQLRGGRILSVKREFDAGGTAVDGQDAAVTSGGLHVESCRLQVGWMILVSG
jgi:hypothetical protein